MAEPSRACIRVRSCHFQLSVHQAVDAEDCPRSAQRNQLDLLRVSRLEPDGSTGRNIQPHTVGGVSIEIQTTVHFKEMAVRTNLNRPITAIRYRNAGCGAPAVGLYRFVSEEVFARNHLLSQYRDSPPNLGGECFATVIIVSSESVRERSQVLCHRGTCLRPEFPRSSRELLP